MKKKSLYEVLGIDQAANQIAIASAYQRLTEEYQARYDAGDAGAREALFNLRAAWDTLGNPERREQYDESLARSDFAAPGSVTGATGGRAPPFAPPPVMDRPAAVAPPRAGGDVATYAARMRAESLYPTIRELTQMVYYIWMALAVVSVIVGVAAIFMVGGAPGFWALILCLFLAVLFVIFARVSRELVLMLVDLSDAAVRIAAKAGP